MIFCAGLCQIEQFFDRGLCIIGDKSHLKHVLRRVLNDGFPLEDVVELICEGNRVGSDIVFIRQLLRDIGDNEIFLFFKHCLCLCDLQIRNIG